MTIKLFADDLKVYCSSKIAENIVKPLQDFIHKFSQYCDINGLSINTNKCQTLHIGNKNQKHSYQLLGNAIKSVEKNESVRDLGLYVTSDLRWNTHIDIVTNKARRVSFAILKSIRFSKPEIMINLFKIYVRPIIEFASNVYNPYLVKDINRLEKIQKDYLKNVFKRANPKLFQTDPFSSLPPYKELLFLYGLESLELRRLKSDLILFHKHLHGYAKINAFNSYKTIKTKTRGNEYKIFPNICKSIVRHNSFFIRTSRIYSKLDSDTRNCDVKLFKLKLDTHPILNKFCKCKI